MVPTSTLINNTTKGSVDLKPIEIGSIKIRTPLLLAPMAGVSDYPFREIARRNGAGLCISEMVTTKTELWGTSKSSFRLPSAKDPEPRPVQIAGADPRDMGEAAKRLADLGAGIIDINMGCPAKKVCAKAAGSALLADEPLIASILETVVEAVDIPVTLKTRTGTDPENKNVVRVARLAESIGVQAITVHGRTRACRFKGDAEYNTIAEVVEALSIPVIANGDIDSPEKARHVLLETGASGLMIGRGAWGKPWLFRQITEHLSNQPITEPTLEEMLATILTHLHLLYENLGAEMGMRFARKHIDKYLEGLDSDRSFRKVFNQLDSTELQVETIRQFISHKNNIISKAA